MRALCIIGLLILASGCASHAVLCGGRLQPINAPADVSKAPPDVPEQAAGRRP